MFRKEVVEFKNSGAYGEPLGVSEVGWGFIYISMVAALIFFGIIVVVLFKEVPIIVNGVFYESRESVSLYAEKDGILKGVSISEGAEVTSGKHIYTLEHSPAVINNYALIRSSITKTDDIISSLDEILSEISDYSHSREKHLSDIIDSHLESKKHSVEIHRLRSFRDTTISKSSAVTEAEKAESFESVLQASRALSEVNGEIKEKRFQMMEINQEESQTKLELNRIRVQQMLNKIQLETNVENSRESQFTEILSPISGVMSSQLVRNGDVVREGDELGVITPKGSRPIVHSYLTSTQMAQIDLDEPVQINLFRTTYTKRFDIEGYIVSISKPKASSGADEQRDGFKVLIELVNRIDVVELRKSHGVRNGLSVDVRIVRKKRDLINKKGDDN